MPRLTKDQWSQARELWESDQTQTDESIAEKFGVSKAAVVKARIKDGWQRHLPPMDELEVIKSKLMMWRKAVKSKKYKEEREREMTALRARMGIDSSEKSKLGFVYLMMVSAGGETWHKIGRASRTKDRLSVVQSGCPWAVSVVAEWAVLDAPETEKKLHALFQGRRGLGEWFSLTTEDVAAIRRMMDA